jgi:hypothetical protein
MGHENPYQPPTSEVRESYQHGATNVSEAVLHSMRGTRPWVLMFAILGFLTVGFMVIAGLAMFAIGASNSELGVGGGAAFGVLYLAIGVLYLFPSLRLLYYANAIGTLLHRGAQADLETALSHQQRFWKFVGIVTLVTLALYVVVLIVAFAIGISAISR